MLYSLTPLSFTLIAFVFALFAGTLGSLLGIGGGIIMTPVLSQLLQVDIRYAFGASIVCVLATSAGSAGAYVRQHMANLRVAILLQLATAVGAVTGGVLLSFAPKRTLFVLFGLAMAFTAFMMVRKRINPRATVPLDPLADRLHLHGHYHDTDTGQHIAYRVTRSKIGLVLMYIGGILSGLLGIGAGSIAMPTLATMRLPFKVCSATSNYMLGVTATATAGIYFAHGWINPFIVGPVALGVFCGATIGTRLVHRIHTKVIRIIFVIILLITAIQMLKKGFTPPDNPTTQPTSASEVHP
ncbi:MAG: sulfite exporter TauE/SafE family protein [Phycisphaerales bacterium]|nr:sulfite exporter TauE/SafE family protein [Phycisphaerales bacterium]